MSRQRSGRYTGLARALLGAVGLLVVCLSMGRSPASLLVAGLLPAWLLFASLITYVRMIGGSPPAERARVSIPLRFSGPMGRFRLRRRGDGRHVQILAADAVVAELRATDLRDEIELLYAVPPEEASDFGSAVGQALALASDADEAHLDWDDHAAPPRSSERLHHRLPDREAHPGW